MRVRRARDDDYAAIARLRRQTIRRVNAGDYPKDVIDRWSAKENAITHETKVRCIFHDF